MPISIVNQAIALKYFYGNLSLDHLLKYTPLFPFLWLINLFARLRRMVAYMLGSGETWHLEERS